MSNRIMVSRNVRTGQMLATFVAAQMDALAQMRRVKAILDSAQYGSPATWAAVAAELGLTGGTAVADAQAACTILANAAAKIDSAEVGELARLDLG